MAKEESASFISKKYINDVVYKNKCMHDIQDVDTTLFRYKLDGEPNMLYRDNHGKRLSYTINNELCQIFITMVDGFSHKQNYNRYTFLDEMKSQAMMQLLTVWHRVKTYADNPHAFFSMIIDNEFKKFLNKQRKARMVKDSIRYENNLPTSDSYESDMRHITAKKEKEYEKNQKITTTNVTDVCDTETRTRIWATIFQRSG